MLCSPGASSAGRAYSSSLVSALGQILVLHGIVLGHRLLLGRVLRRVDRALARRAQCGVLLRIHGRIGVRGAGGLLGGVDLVVVGLGHGCLLGTVRCGADCGVLS